MSRRFSALVLVLIGSVTVFAKNPTFEAAYRFGEIRRAERRRSASSPAA